MKKIDIFEFGNYKSYIRSWIKAQPRGGRGIRSRLASRMKCHTAYITQVLNYDSHLSMEQAEDFNYFSGHNREQAEYFLLLVQLARAGSPLLKDRISLQIEDFRNRHLLLRNRVKVDPVLSQGDQQIYYSSWVYAAVHILVTIGGYNTRGRIGSRLNIPESRTRLVLDFLVAKGLLVENAGIYSVGKTHIFLGSDSPYITQHHTNWRIKAIESLGRVESRDLHLSTVLSLSRSDVSRVKEMLIQSIQEVRKLARESKEEELHCFSLDFFEI